MCVCVCCVLCILLFSQEFGRGDFIGDIDALLASGNMSSKLVAITDGVVFELRRSDLLRFFSQNPGVLLSLLHTEFIC